jgi:hypothetical protein
MDGEEEDEATALKKFIKNVKEQVFDMHYTRCTHDALCTVHYTLCTQ